MPMHDWTRVEAGIYHDFLHGWISEIKRVLNRELLPADLYALAEQHAAGFGPDVLTLQDATGDANGGGVAVRHVSGDRIVAMIELVSPGNKNNANAFRAFVDKACELLEHRIHLLILDPFPPGRRDPAGIHAAIWAQVDDAPYRLPPDKPLTLVAYDCGIETEAHIEPVAVGQALPDMPLFIEPGGHILVPLEATYMAAWETVPARWRRVIAPTS